MCPKFVLQVAHVSQGSSFQSPMVMTRVLYVAAFLVHLRDIEHQISLPTPMQVYYTQP